MNLNQASYYQSIKEFIRANEQDSPPLTFNTSNMPAKERNFITRAARDFGLDTGFSSTPHSKTKNQIFVTWMEDEDSDAEGLAARTRIMKRYDEANIIDEEVLAARQAGDHELSLASHFLSWKESYYKVFAHIDEYRAKCTLISQN